jgi:outer membrane protein insertion porin family
MRPRGDFPKGRGHKAEGRKLFALCPVLFALTILCLSACRETGTVEVSSISFKGNSAIDSAELRKVIATQENSILPFTRSHYFDRAEFERDLQRIQTYYADHGYPNAKVAEVGVKLNSAKDKASITVSIVEGTPVIVESIGFEGLDAIPADHLATLKSTLPILAGKPRDQSQILAAHDLTLGELRDHGFPYATVKAVERPGSAADRVQIVFEADTGPSAVFGSITIEGNTSVSDEILLRELTFHRGEEYRLSAITESQRRLYSLELFQFANITPKLPETREAEVPVVITVAEGKQRRLQLAAGYGSEEKARGRVNWRHVNFTGGARTLETEGKWSWLEHGLKGTFTEPYLFTTGLSLTLTGASWWLDEPTYTDQSNGGQITLTKQFGRGTAGVMRGVYNEVRVSFISEHESYAISNSGLQDPSLRDQFIALGLNPATGEGDGTLSAIEIDYVRDTSGRNLESRRGYMVQSHVQWANDWLGSFRYTELAAELRRYFPIGERFVWANRLQAGSLLGDSATIPFYKRYFLGGSTSVRGWGRYQISPLSGSGLPIGGQSMAEMSTEARFGLSRRLSGVLFLDGGNVWAESLNVDPTGLRWAVGPGLRYQTPVGPIRMDLGFQLNPIPGLLVNGSPERRPWRVHFSIGQAF